jgi:hypothetical protein
MGPPAIFGIENVVVPGGDPGERLVANLILSTIALDLQAETAARKYLANAHLLAMELAGQSVVYRPPRPSHFARLTCEFDGLTETLLLPVISNILVLPSIAPEGVAGTREAVAVDVKALDLARFMLRLRPRRIASILETLETGALAQQASDTMRRILKACTRHELPTPDALDRANDFFTVARSLIGKQNIPLAVIALTNADRALADAHTEAASDSDRAATLLQMKQQIAQMLGELKRAAMQ